jgi:hypothetical protein
MDGAGTGGPCGATQASRQRTAKGQRGFFNGYTALASRQSDIVVVIRENAPQ